VEKPALPPDTPPPAEEAPDTSFAASAPKAFVFTRENMPRLDGSTSTAPLAEAVCSVLLGESRAAVADLVQFNKTTTAYNNLLYGNADLLIVGEDNAEILEEKARIGFEWEKSPFATDAFVFVVNEDNRVDSITIDEARRIYTGEITNWRELGGDDSAILPFQRNQDAGSQNLMEKLVMRGLPMLEAPAGFVAATMGQLMEVVKSYDGSPGAIGYTVYYYAEEMKMAQGLKILALEGVAPNPETIRSQEYPLLNPKYVIIPANAPPDAPNRILYNWLLGEEGQQLVAREGYVAAGPLPSIGSRWYDGYTENLLARDGYGELIPYAGARLLDNWPAITGCLYGLMTKNGVAVTDAVYSSVSRPTYYGGQQPTAHPLLALRRGESGGGDDAVRSLYAIAALDGSWCTEFCYRFLRPGKSGLLLFADDGVTYMSPSGKIKNFWSMAKLGLEREQLDAFFADLYWGEGWGGQWHGDYLTIGAHDDHSKIDLFHLPTGQLKTMPLTEWDAYVAAEYLPLEEPSQEELSALLPPGQSQHILFRRDGFSANGLPGLLLTYQDGYVQVFLPDGTHLTALSRIATWYYQIQPVGGLIEVLDLNTASYYDPATMECVFRTYLGYERD
jgi:phosphate transport system substrate-binding protein